MFFKAKSILQVKDLIFCLKDISKEYFGQGRTPQRTATDTINPLNDTRKKPPSSAG